MADSIDYDKMGDAMFNALERYYAGKPGGGSGKGSSNTAAIKETSSRLIELAKASKDSTKSISDQRDAAKHFSSSLKNTADYIAKANKTAAERIEEFSKSIDEVADGNVKWAADQKKQFAQQVRQNDVNKANAERAEQFGKGLDGVKNAFAPLAGAIGKVVDSYQSFSDGGQIKLASSIFQAEVKLAGSSAQNVGTGLSTLGQATAGASSKIGKGLSTAATVGGAALTLFGKAANTVADTVLPKVASELEMYYKSFQGMSASGAMFTDGITGMGKASAAAGLTLGQMDGVLKRNSSLMAEMGGGVTGAVQDLGRVSQTMKKSGIQDNLLKLGYSFEQQADLTAETMANMQRYAKGPVDDKAVAAETQKYAENLRLISAITGEDAKKKVAAAKEAADFLAFNQKKAKMSTEQQAQIDAAMATMTKQEQKNFMDRVVYNGQVVNKEGRIYESMIDGASEKGAKQYELLQQGILTADSNAKLNQDYADRMGESIKNADALGQAGRLGIGAMGDVASAANDTLKQTTVYGKGARDKARKDVVGQGKTTDPTTNSMLAVAKAGQDAATKIQEAILDSEVIDKFAKAIAGGTESLIGMIDKFKGGKGGDSAGGGMGMGEMLMGGLMAAGTVAQVATGFSGLFKKSIPTPGEIPTPKGPVSKAGGWLGRMAGFGMSAGGALLSGLGGGAGAAAGAAGAAGAGAAGAAGSTAGAIGAGAASAAGAGATAAENAAKGLGSAASSGASTAAKGLAGAGKAVGKSILKKIPLIGLGIGLWDAAGRVAKGDYAGAAMSAASGVASTVPGAGTLVSTAIDAAQMGTDASGLTGQEAPVPATPSDQGAGAPTSNLNDSQRQFAEVTEEQRATAISQMLEEKLKAAGVDTTANSDKLAKEKTDSMQDMTALLATMARTMEEQLDLMRNISNNTRNTVSAVS